MIHPFFSVEHMPVIVAQNSQTESGLSVEDVSQTRTEVGKVDLNKSFQSLAQLFISQDLISQEIRLIGKYEGDCDFSIVCISTL